MSPWLPLLLAILILSIPGFLLIRRRGGESEAMPEIRGPLRWLHGVFRVYWRLWHGLRTDGYAPLPGSGPAILIANHTCGIDHVLLQAASRRLLGFMVAREYYESPWLHWICSHIGCIPVNRDGRDLAAIRAAPAALDEGRVVPIFPEGHDRARVGASARRDAAGQRLHRDPAGVPVVPAYHHRHAGDQRDPRIAGDAVAGAGRLRRADRPLGYPAGSRPARRPCRPR